MNWIDAGERGFALAEISLASDWYYADGTSPLSDTEFDSALLAYEVKFGKKGSPRSAPAKAKGRTDRHATAAHDYPLLSGWLDKAQTPDEFREWASKRGLTRFLCSPKYDGLSATVSYRNGQAIRATTRGENGMGVDVTSLVAGESHFDTQGEFGVRYECVMTWSDVDRMSTDLGKEYKNPRNLVAGILASDDRAAKRDYVLLVPLDIDHEDVEGDHASRLNTLAEMIDRQFTANGDRETPWDWAIAESVDDVIEYYEQIMAARTAGEFGYMLDGIVIEALDAKDVTRLGGRSSTPDYAIALKFPPMTATTRAVSIDWDVGATGRRTPVVNYEPVTLEGRTFSRTSLSNVTRFDELKLCPGTPLRIEIRGDVLAWCDRAGPDPEGAVPFEIPEGFQFSYNDAGQRVFAYAEAQLDGRCERVMVKMGVRGVKIETVTKLVEGGLVTKLADMFTLERERVAALPGLGTTSADLLCSAIEAKLDAGVKDWEVLASLGIEGVGRTLAKSAMAVVSLDELMDMLTERAAGDAQCDAWASALHAAVGPERCRIILDGAVERLSDLVDLVALTKPIQSKGAFGPSYSGQTYKVVVTGDLVGWGRDQFKDLIESMGHKMLGSVSKNCDILITNTPTSGTVKNRKARELGIPILTEKEAVERLGLASELPDRFKAPEPVEVDLTDL